MAETGILKLKQGPTPLHIVFVAPFGLRKKTTVWARILPLARHLHSVGHTVQILIPPWDSPEDAGAVETQAGVTIEHVPVYGGPLLIMVRLLRRLCEIRPDIVHIVKPRAYAGLVQWSIWYGRRLFAPDIRLCLDVDDWEQAWAPYTQYPWPVEPFLAWQEEWGVRHADGITAASTWLVNKVRSVSPHIPIHHLPNGVSPLTPSAQRRAIEPAKADHPPSQRILFFSRFIEVPPQWLAQFWRAIRIQLPHAQLVVVGRALQPGQEAHYQAAMNSLALSAGTTSGSEPDVALESDIDWIGYVQPDQLADVYAAVDCAIFPAMPTVLQQAKCSVRLATTLLYGVPCVASQVGEQQFYGAGGAAHLVSADATPEEFASAVIEVLGDPDARLQLAKQAREHLLANYDWQRLGAGLEEFYCSQIVASSGSNSGS